MREPLGPAADAVGAQTAILLARLGTPPLIKRAAAAAMPSWRGLPPVCYADAAGSYPIHTPIAALVSAACYLAAGAGDPVTASVIKRACDVHGLGEAWTGLAERARAAAEPPEPARYALPGQKKYPIDTAARVVKAAAYLEAYGAAMPEADRKTYAANLLAADPGVLSPPARRAVEHAAGLGRPAVPLVQVFGPRKAAAAGRPEIVAALDRLEQAVAGGGDAYKAAAVLGRIDRVMGWRFRDPEPLLTGLTPSAAKAAAAELVRAPSGDYYARADLARVPAAVLMAAYDTGPVVSAEKRAALLAEHGERFQAFLSDCGVEPVRRAGRGSPPAADWAGWAGD